MHRFLGAAVAPAAPRPPSELPDEPRARRARGRRPASSCARRTGRSTRSPTTWPAASRSTPRSPRSWSWSTRSTRLRDDAPSAGALRFALATAASLLFPFAPHAAADVYELLTGERVWEEPWPDADPALLERDTLELVCQVNGKVRDRVAGAGRRVARRARGAGARGAQRAGARRRPARSSRRSSCRASSSTSSCAERRAAARRRTIAVVGPGEASPAELARGRGGRRGGWPTPAPSSSAAGWAA